MTRGHPQIRIWFPTGLRSAAQNHPQLQQQNLWWDSQRHSLEPQQQGKKGFCFLGFLLGERIGESVLPKRPKTALIPTATKNQSAAPGQHEAQDEPNSHRIKKKKGSENSVDNTGRWEAQNPNSVFTKFFHLEKVTSRFSNGFSSLNQLMNNNKMLLWLQWGIHLSPG